MPTPDSTKSPARTARDAHGLTVPAQSTVPAWSTVAAWAVAAALTAWILWGPYIFFAYHSASARLVSETVVLCVALLAAYLSHGRFVREQRWQDLILAQGLVTLALAAMPVSGLIARVLPGVPGAKDVWLPALLQLAGALLLFLAVAVGRRRTLPGATVVTARWATLLAPVLALAVVVTAMGFLGDTLPVAVDTAYEQAERRPNLLTAHPGLITTQLLGSLSLLGASLVAAGQAMRRGDTLLRWLGPACALGGFGRLLFALTPSLYTDWFYAGDLLRLGMYVVLLAGSGRELSAYWTARTASAVLADRRRLAGELHDGLVQELTYIRGEAHTIDSDPDLRERVIGAADRALDEARAAIHALTRRDDEPMAEVLRRTAHELARRHRMEVTVEAEDVHVKPADVHTLLRIVREAVTNAARHGRAQAVQIGLTAEGGTRVLAVRDDGSGFDPDEVARGPSGYGLISMAERARSLPGTLSVDSRLGAGSEVRVTW